MTEKLKPANRVLAALMSEHGRVHQHDVAAQSHGEATDHTEHHDLHRFADDGCPHHAEDAFEVPMCGALPVVVQKSDRDIYKDASLALSYGLHLPTDAKARKALPICTGVLDYFPKAIAAVAEVSRIGNDQHNPGQPLHWAKGKSTDHADCAIRHFAERGSVDVLDGGRHTAKAAWRVLAHLEMEIEAEEAGMSYADYIAHLKAQEASK